MTKRILVTGGAGFIGSHLCRFLLLCDHEVICLDNFYTGSKFNLRHALHGVTPKRRERLEVIRHDITQPIHIEVDQIYNLACPASPIHYQRHPVETIKTCVHGAINVLDLARRTGARILQASTSEVYGDPEVHPQHESYWGRVNPNGIRACYDEGKRCAEALFMDYSREYGVDIRIARIFNTYGPYMHPNDGRVVSNFICQILRNEDITIYGNGLQTRCFMYVDDLIYGLQALMNTENCHRPINLGNPVETTMKGLVVAVKKHISKTKSEVTYCPLPQDDPTKRKPVIDRAREEIGWKPEIDLDMGLYYTIHYFRQLLNGRLGQLPGLDD